MVFFRLLSFESCYCGLGIVVRNNDELRRDAADALCCLAHALGEDFTIFIPSIHKLLLKHHLRVLESYLISVNLFLEYLIDNK